MTTKIYTFAKVSRKDGQIFIGFAGTKQGISFDSFAQMKDMIREAYEKDRFHQMLMALGAFLKANPVNPNPADLNGTTFTADDGNG